MAIKSNTERLESVEAAITAIEEGAQEYWIGTRKVRRADIKALYAQRSELIRVVASEANGDSMTSIGVYGGVE